MNKFDQYVADITSVLRNTAYQSIEQHLSLLEQKEAQALKIKQIHLELRSEEEGSDLENTDRIKTGGIEMKLRNMMDIQEISLHEDSFDESEELQSSPKIEKPKSPKSPSRRRSSVKTSHAPQTVEEIMRRKREEFVNQFQEDLRQSQLQEKQAMA